METEKVNTFNDVLYRDLEEVDVGTIGGVDGIGGNTTVQSYVVAPVEPLSPVIGDFRSESQQSQQTQQAKNLIAQDLDQIKDHSRTMEFYIPKSELSKESNLDTQVRLKDYLKSPDTDEVQSLARDGHNGEIKRLSKTQLNQIHATGKFTVPSQQFAPHVHEWEVKNFFQKGVADSVETFKNGLALSLEHFVIFVPNRLWRHEDFSFFVGLKSFVSGFLGLFVQMIGGVERKTVFPSESEKSTIRLDTFLSNFLTDPDSVSSKDVLTGKVRRIYTYEGVTILTDLTFGDSQLRSKIREPYEKFMKQWEIDTPRRRQTLALQLAPQFSTEELPQEVVNTEAIVLQEEIFKLIHETSIQSQNTTQTTIPITSESSSEISEENDNNKVADNVAESNVAERAIESSGAKDLCNLILAVQLIRDSISHYRLTRDNAHHIYMNELKEKHSLLSRLPKWTAIKSSNFLKKYDIEHPFSQVIEGLSERLSGQEKYIFDSNTASQADFENNVKKATKKEPGKVFKWNFHIWRPSHYKVIENKREEGGESWYQLSKYRKFKTTSNYPGWRFANLFLRIGQFFVNGLRGLVAWMSFGPLGFRSLWGINDYQPDKTVNRQTGELIPTGPVFSTWVGRIRNLWTHIKKSVDDFHAKPDNGTFGKSLQKPFVVGFWNYFCKGVIGTLFAFVGHPILTLLNIGISGALILTSPVWAIGGSVFIHLFNMLIYDFDATETDVSFINPEKHPNTYKQRNWFPIPRLLIGDMLILGLGRMIAAPLVAVGNVALGTVGYLLSTLRYTFTRIWDNVMFYCVWKPFGRVPNRNDYFSTRISGPGLSMKYFQIIKSDIGILMIKYSLEKDKVASLRKEIEEHIDQPSNRLKKFYAQFKELGLIEDISGTKTKEFAATKTELYKRLDKAVRDHFDSLIVDGTISNNNVRFTRQDLVHCIEQGTEICKNYCEKNQTNFPSNWWSCKSVVEGDYENLAIYFLKSVFGNSIIQPIEEADPEGFRINVDESTLPKYVKMVCKGTEKAFATPLEQVTVEKPLIPDDRYPSQPTNITIVTPFNIDQQEPEEALVTLRKINQVSGGNYQFSRNTF